MNNGRGRGCVFDLRCWIDKRFGGSAMVNECLSMILSYRTRREFMWLSSCSIRRRVVCPCWSLLINFRRGHGDFLYLAFYFLLKSSAILRNVILSILNISRSLPCIFSEFKITLL